MTEETRWGLIAILERDGDTFDLELVRELTTEERDRLESCRRLLLRFSALSPFEQAVAKYQAFLSAEEHARQHKVAADIAKCLDLAASTLRLLMKLPGDFGPEDDKTEPVSESVASNLTALRNVAAPVLEAVANPNAALLASTGVMLTVAHKPVPLSAALSYCLASAENIEWQLAQDLTKRLDRSCAFVRHLAADVPIGIPAISSLPIATHLQPEPLPIEDALYVQRLIRSPAPPPLSDLQSRDQTAVEAALPRPVNLIRRQESEGSTGQGRDAIPSVQPSLDKLVTSLRVDLAHFLSSWSNAIDRQLLKDDLEKVRAAVAVIAGMIATAVTECRLSGAKLPKYPPDEQTLSDLANDDQRRLQLEALGEVTAAQILAEQAARLPASRELNRDVNTNVLVLDPSLVRDLLTLSVSLVNCVQSESLPREFARLQSAECLSAGRMLGALAYALAAGWSDDSADDRLQIAAAKVMNDCIAGRVSEACCAPYAQLILDLHAESIRR